MKPGDMVKFHDRLVRSPGLRAKAGRVYLVLRRDMGARKKEPDKSMWANWHIVDMETRQVFVQIGRDLHVLEENNNV